jgi:hypothetical protein
MSRKERRKARRGGLGEPFRHQMRGPADAVIGEIVFDGEDCFIIRDGVKIAKRGHPGTPQAGTWISLEPGWRVLDGPDPDSIVIEYEGVLVQ